MYRSVLMAPGNDLRKIGKALEMGADCVVLDLEDSIALTEKENARKVLVQVRPTAVPTFVRTNAVSGEFFFRDVEAALQTGSKGILVPKVETPEEVAVADWYLSQWERELKLSAGSTELTPLIESARGLANLRSILRASPRIRRTSFGSGDLMAELSWQLTETELELLPVRTQMVVESAAAGLEPPLDCVHIEFKDTDRFARAALIGRQLGFQGKVCIHPAQIPVVNRLYSPTEEETTWARKLLAAFAAAESQGQACFVFQGQMVDYVSVKRAERILSK